MSKRERARAADVRCAEQERRGSATTQRTIQRSNLPMFNSRLFVEVIKVAAKFVAAAGGGAAIAWLIFSKFGDRWLEQRFAKRLEEFKH